MSKPIKDMMTRHLQDRFDGVASACVVDLSGLDAINTNRMRGELKKQDINVRVVKNRLARRALSGGPLEALAQVLEGPCAVVYGEPPVVDIAKELAKWSKQHKVIQLKHGIMDGDPDLFTVDELSKMKGKTELLADIAMLLASPGRSLAAALSSPASKIAGCLEAMIEKQEN